MQSIAPGVWSVVHGTPEPLSPVALREVPVAVAALAAMPAAGDPAWAAGLRCEVTDRGVLIRLPLADGASLYGLGLQLKSHEQRGKKRVLRVNSDPLADTGDSHAPVPFIASTSGWALLVDTARYASFYTGGQRRAADLAEPVAGTIGTSTEELYKARAGGPRELVIEVPVARGATIYLFGGPTLKDAVRRYNLFSGGGCLPPLWGLGVWYRAFGKAGRAEVEGIADGLRADRIPCDVLGLEPGWQTAAYPCSYRWAEDRFPDHRGFLDGIRGRGFHVNCWEHAYVHPTAPVFSAILPHAGPNAVFDGLVPDFTIPAARRAYADHHRALAVEGISGFKLDECDNSDFISYPWCFPEHDRFPSGLDGERMHSLFGMLYMRTVHEVYAGRGVRAYHEVRNAGALAAPYPFVLYSDLYDHRDFVRGVLSSGFSGLLWSPEVRHATGVEDLVRRVQAVAMSAQALVNAWYIPQPPWANVDRAGNNRGESMPERELATALVRDAFRLRMALVPVIYAAFARYQADGTPPFRALAMDFPEDAEARTVDDQWMIGDDLLFAPVFAGQAARSVYLPAGDWFEFASGRRITGGQRIEEATPVERILLYVRSGTILPMAEPVACIAPDTVFRLTVRVYGADPRPCELREDDGDSDAWERGARNHVRLSWSDGVGRVERNGAWPGRRYEVAGWERING
jgi:alpha-D-xyloside xylohydrolase